ncbi:MAG TPA: alkaline phosphatase family protein, partial [Anaerolineales bacterium]|nr:alkaline phosphatase family protein [Anaerolineales bacterium]
MKTTVKIILLFLLLILPACQSSSPQDLLTRTPSLTSTLTVIATTTHTDTATVTDTSTPTAISTPAPRARRVLILSIDGLRPDVISLAPMPNLLSFMQSSAYSLSAQTVLPSVTLVSHSSMLTSYCPSDHGVYWNDYIPEFGYAIGTDLFDIAHAAGLWTEMIAGKAKLQQVTEPASLDNFVFINDR